MNEKRIEVFTAGCAICQSTVEMVKSVVGTLHEVVIYNVTDQKEAMNKAQDYGVKSLPAIAVNGTLLSCCQERKVCESELRKALAV